MPTAQRFVERARGFSQEFYGLEHVVQHDRLIHVKLEVSLRTGEGHCMVVTKDLHCYHGHCLALSGVDLAGHDGGTRFVFGKLKFREAGPWTACIPTNIVRDLHQRAGEGPQRAAQVHHPIVSREGSELIGRGAERFASFLCDLSGSDSAEAWTGIKPCSDRRPADGKRVNGAHIGADTVERLVPL